MLRYLKLSILIVLLLGLMGCPAPNSSNTDQNITQTPPVEENPSQDDNVIPGLPDDIGGIIEGAVSGFWVGRPKSMELVSLYRDGEGRFPWRLRIVNGSGGELREYFSYQDINGSTNITNNQWSADFYLKNPNYKPGSSEILAKSEMKLTMKFVSTREAIVTLSKTSYTDTNTYPYSKDYGEFKMYPN